MSFGRLLVNGLATLLLCWATVVLAQSGGPDYEKAVQAYEERKYSEAYIHLKNVLKDDPDNVSARLLLAQVHFSVGDIYSAEKEASEALLLGADINLVLPVYGPSLVLQKKVTRLFELEQAAGSFTPENQFEWALLKGQGYLIRGDRDNALFEFERAAALFPEQVRSNNTVAAIYLAYGMLDKAREHIEKSMALDNQVAKTWELKGELTVKEQGYAEALSDFQRAYELDDKDIKVLRALARTHLELGNRAEVKDYLAQILEQSPDDPAATLISAIMMIGEGEPEAGDSMLADLSNKLSEMDFVQNQSNDTMVFIQASADYIRGNDQNAMALFNAYLSRNRGDLAAIRMLVDLYLRNGDKKEAIEFLDTHEPEIAGDASLSIRLAHLHIEEGKLYAGRKIIERLKTMLPADHPYLLLLQAELMQARDQPGQALALLSAREFTGQTEPLSYALLRGSLQLQVRDLAGAEANVLSLREIYPENLRVLNFCAITYLALEKEAEAAACLDKTLSQSPGNVEARFGQAMLHKRQGQYEESSKLLNGILEERPGHTRSILLMARMLMLQGKADEAVDWSNKVYAYERDATLPAELQLEIYENAGNWSRARKVAQQLTRTDPNNSKYAAQLARAYMELGETELAGGQLRRLFSQWTDDARRLNYLARLQAGYGLTADARVSLERALELDPESYQTRVAMAQLELLEHQYKRVLESATALEQKYGERVELLNLQGEVALARKQDEKAQALFMRAFELDQNNPGAIRRLYELASRGVGAQAYAAAMEQTLAESSLPMMAVRLLADNYLLQGEYANAAKYYEQLIELEQVGEDPEILNNLANIYAADDLDKALATARRALAVQEEHSPALLDTTGWILSRQGKHEEALFYLRQAYAKNSTDPEIRYHTAVSLHALGRTEEARKELRAALDMGRGFTGKPEAEQLFASMSN